MSHRSNMTIGNPMGAALVCLAALMCLAGSGAAWAQVRAADGEEVVLKRNYPKTGTFEVAVDAGVILNPTFVDTRILSGTVRYHWSEAWGLGLTVAGASTSDRAERTCVESFYNDPDHLASQPCASQDGGAAGANSPGKVDLGPAYMPIRELRTMVTGAFDYTIAYGKQIILTGAVTNFDLRLRFGGGVLESVVYDERTTVKNAPDTSSRGDPATAGVPASDTDSYGQDGRPDPRAETSPVILLGLQEEVFFLKRCFVSGEITWYTTTGINGGVDPFFVAQLGGGVKF